MRQHFLFFLLTLSSFAFPHEVLDVERLPFLRTKQYAKAPYEKIVIFSGHRTCSSLLYNVFRFLFEEDEFLLLPHAPFYKEKTILKTHGSDHMELLKGTKFLTVVPLRHPINAAVSMCRFSSQGEIDLKEWAMHRIYHHANVLFFAEKLIEDGQDVLFFKYEECKELSKILDQIERWFSIVIAAEDRKTLERGLSKENVLANINSLYDSSEVLPLSGFHGRHIFQGKCGVPDELFFWLDYYYEQLQPIFSRYSYFFKND